MNKNRVITRNPTLNQSELLNGCDLLIDSGADTFVVGKHGFVTEIIEGVSVSAQGFSDAQPQLEDLPIVNAVYAYDDENSGEVILLEVNHCIYLGSQKNDAIACPNQMRVHGVHVDDRPRSLFPNEKNAQSILVNDITLPLKMRGPLVYLPVRRPSLPELNNDNLRVLELTSPHGWDPYAEDTISTQNMLHFTYGCKISTFLSKIVDYLVVCYLLTNETFHHQFWLHAGVLGSKLLVSRSMPHTKNIPDRLITFIVVSRQHASILAIVNFMVPSHNSILTCYFSMYNQFVGTLVARSILIGHVFTSSIL